MYNKSMTIFSKWKQLYYRHLNFLEKPTLPGSSGLGSQLGADPSLYPASVTCHPGELE